MFGDLSSVNLIDFCACFYVGDFVSFHSVGPQSSSMLQMVLEVGVIVTYIFLI